MKVYVDCDERYPDYLISDADDTSSLGVIQVDRATYERWCDVFGEYDKAQREIEAAFKGAQK